MKTYKQGILKVIFLCMITLSSLNLAQAQSNSSPWWDGLKEGLENFVNDVENSPEAKEAWRWMTIYNTDIRMWMNGGMAKSSGSSKGRAKESVYAEFDWDNLAEKMVVTGIEKSGPVVHTLYTDKTGNLYSPYEGGYIKVNVPKTILDLNGTIDLLGKSIAINELLAANSAHFNQALEMFSILYSSLGGREGIGFLTNIISNYIYQLTGRSSNPLGALLDYSDADLINVIDGLRNLLVENGLSGGIADMLANLQRADDMGSLVGFPIFIHWAMLYSSETIRSQFPVTESEVSCPDGSTGCTKLTISSGKERGKSVTFDQFGRLVYIDALKDGNCRFSYDRDLTVNLPPAITFREAVNQHR